MYFLKFIRTGCLVLTLCAYCSSSFAQTLEEDLEIFLEKIRNKGGGYMDPSLVKYDNVKLLSLLEEPSKDANVHVQVAACVLNGHIASLNPNSKAIQKEVINRLIDDCFEESPYLRQGPIGSLIRFDTKHFSKKVKKRLSKLINERVETNEFNKETALLIGVAGLQNQSDFLKEYIRKNPLDTSYDYWHRTPSWGAYLALARLKGGAYSDFCLSQVKMLDKSVLFREKIFEDLSHTRDLKIASFLLQFIYSEEKLSWSCAEGFGYPVAYSVIPPLVSMISGFPESINYGVLQLEGLEQARAWLKKQKTLKIKK